jgi:translation initiation factor IF-2
VLAPRERDVASGVQLRVPRLLPAQRDVRRPEPRPGLLASPRPPRAAHRPAAARTPPTHAGTQNAGRGAPSLGHGSAPPTAACPRADAGGGPGGRIAAVGRGGGTLRTYTLPGTLGGRMGVRAGRPARFGRTPGRRYP